MASNTSKRTFDAFTEPNGSESDPTTSQKRARSESDLPLWNMIQDLDPLATRNILYQICLQNPSLAVHVHDENKARLAAEAIKPPVDFNHYSKSCWYALNKQYARMSSSSQYDMVGDVCAELSAARAGILELAGPSTRWETRRNALEVLRKICKSVMLCEEDQIRHEIMKDGYELGEFATAMTDLAQAMTEQERDRYKEEGLYQKLVDLQNECDWETDMEGLRELYETFDGPDDGDEEIDEEEEEEEEEVDEGDEKASALSGNLPTNSIQSAVPQRTKVFSVGELA